MVRMTRFAVCDSLTGWLQSIPIYYKRRKKEEDISKVGWNRYPRVAGQPCWLLVLVARMEALRAVPLQCMVGWG